MCDRFCNMFFMALCSKDSGIWAEWGMIMLKGFVVLPCPVSNLSDCVLILSNSYNSVDNAPVCVSAFLDCSFSIRGRDALHTRLSASILKLAVCTVELVVAPYAR